jgi:hypothetical protein
VIFPARSPDAAEGRTRAGEWRLVLAALVIAALVIAVALATR